MSVLPLPDLDALSLDELKKLVVQLLVRVSALEEENQQLRAENARLKALPKKPKLAPGGMDKASEPDKRARTKQARRQWCNRQSGRRTAAWVTVDDTAARHAGANEYTTHIGNDRFAWFATRPSKSRLNFLDLLRAGRPDYVINATAAAYLVEHKVAEAVIVSLLGHERRSFADDAAWQAHLDSFGLGAGQRRRITEAAMIGSIVARGLLTDTVIVSDDAGQFDVFQHALCWIHAERHLRRIVCVTDQQHRRCSASWSGGSTLISNSTRTTRQPAAERR
jgi:hypothetical protein